MAEWIDVNERLPELNTRVLVYYFCAEGYSTITVARFDKYTNGDIWWELDDDNQELCIVTHWMPLPEPPRTPKERGAEQ